MRMKYFQALNNNGLVTIDDTYRCLFYLGTLNLNNGISKPITPTYRNDESATSGKWGLNFLQFDHTDIWMSLQGSPFLSNSTYPKYMGYLAQVDAKKLYGIRFKKAISNTKILVRMNYSALGNAIKGNNSICTLFIEVMCSNSSISISECMNYFDIVVLANDKNSMPYCNQGAEIRNADGAVIWNSSCKMVNVIDLYNNAQAGSYSYSGFTNNHIVIPTKTYKQSRCWDSDAGRHVHSAQYKDYFVYDGNKLRSEIVTIKGDVGNTVQRADIAIWDIRDFGNDPNKNISGMIARM